MVHIKKIFEKRSEILERQSLMDNWMWDLGMKWWGKGIQDVYQTPRLGDLNGYQ